MIMDMGEYGDLPQEQNGCSDPGIVVDQQTGEIFCAAVWMLGKPGKHQWVEDGSEPGYEIGKSAQFMMVRSTDDGRTWSKPENMTRKLKKAEWISFGAVSATGNHFAGWNPGHARRRTRRKRPPVLDTHRQPRPRSHLDRRLPGDRQQRMSGRSIGRRLDHAQRPDRTARASSARCM